MTRYYTKVASDLLPEIREGSRLPDGLRVVSEYNQVDDGFQLWTLVEFEDDSAPAEMEGRLVTPVISIDYVDGEVARTWISDWYVEHQARVITPSTTAVTYRISGLTSDAPAQRGGEEER